MASIESPPRLRNTGLPNRPDYAFPRVNTPRSRHFFLVKPAQFGNSRQQRIAAFIQGCDRCALANGRGQAFIFCHAVRQKLPSPVDRLAHHFAARLHLHLVAQCLGLFLQALHFTPTGMAICPPVCKACCFANQQNVLAVADSRLIPLTQEQFSKGDGIAIPAKQFIPISTGNRFFRHAISNLYFSCIKNLPPMS